VEAFPNPSKGGKPNEMRLKRAIYLKMTTSGQNLNVEFDLEKSN
jgi:hypothetical protein